MKIPEGKKNGNIILVELKGEDVLYYDLHPEEKEKKLEILKAGREGGWYSARENNLEMTLQTACIFDTSTNQYSDTSVYKNKKGSYLKKKGKRYFIVDFK